MSVLDRLNRLVRSNLNHLSSRAGGRQILGEVRDSLREARSQLVESRLAEKRLAAEYEDLLDQSQAWEDRAMIALQAGDEPLARQALGRKHRIDAEGRRIKADLDGHRTHVGDLLSSLDAMEVKLEALRERGQASARSRPSGDRPPGSSRPSAARERRLAELEAGGELGLVGDPTLFDDFEDMSRRLARSGVELDAVRELTPPSYPSDPLADTVSDDQLLARFRVLEADRDLDRLKSGKGLSDLRQRLDDE